MKVENLRVQGVDFLTPINVNELSQLYMYN